MYKKLILRRRCQALVSENPELHNAAVVRFDFVEAEEDEAAIDILNGVYGQGPTKSPSKINAIGGEITRRSYHSTAPNNIDNLSGYFENVGSHILSGTQPITDVITIGYLSDEEIKKANTMGLGNGSSAIFQSWRESLNTIIKDVPTLTQRNAESSIVLLDFGYESQVSKGGFPDKPEEIEEEFAYSIWNGIDRQRGSSVLWNSWLLIPGQNDSLVKDLYALDLSQNIEQFKTISEFTADLNGIDVLSRFFRAECWRIAREGDLNTTLENLNQMQDTMYQSLDNGSEPNELFDEQKKIQGIKDYWVDDYRRIISEAEYLLQTVKSPSVDFSSSTNSDLVTISINTLRRGVENVKNSADMTDSQLDSLTDYYYNQVSTVSSKVNIDLQNEIRILTRVLTALTVVLVAAEFNLILGSLDLLLCSSSLIDRSTAGVPAYLCEVHPVIVTVGLFLLLVISLLIYNWILSQIRS